MPNPTTLRSHEWLAILTLILILLILSLMAILPKSSMSSAYKVPLSNTSANKIEVIVKGCVNNPGVYMVPPNTTLKELLSLAVPCPEADLRRWQLNSPIKRSRAINVKKRQIIYVHLRGAVKTQGPVAVPKGSKMEDLIGLAELAENADLNALKKKRKLVPDEIIIVPEESCCEK